MRKIIIAILGLVIIVGCNRNASQSTSVEDTNSKPLESAKEYKPNPDEVVISAKLISYEDEIATVEVVQQISTGFGAKAVLIQGDQLLLSTQAKPSANFMCAFEFADTMGDKKVYRITRFLK